VSGAKGVVNTFFATRKTGDAAFLPQLGHARLTPGQDFMPIGLMAHIPYQSIFRGVKYIVQRNGQLDRAQVRRKVTAGSCDCLDNIVAQFLGQHR